MEGNANEAGLEWDDFFDEPMEETAGGVEETGVDPAAEEFEEAGTETGMEPEGAEGFEGAGTETDGGDPDEAAGEEQPEETGADNAAEIQRGIDAFVAQRFGHMTNPYTGKPITTQAELEAYQQAYDEEERRRRVQESGVDENLLNDIINNHPAVRQAQETMLQQQRQAANDFMAKEFDALKKEYPDCGFDDPEAMFKSEDGKKAMDLWRDSPRLTLADAYMITNKEAIRARQSAAVKQGVMNQVNGKKHLTQTKGSTAQGGMPADEYENFKMFFPDATREEIEEMWKKGNQ